MWPGASGQAQSSGAIAMAAPRPGGLSSRPPVEACAAAVPSHLANCATLVAAQNGRIERGTVPCQAAPSSHLCNCATLPPQNGRHKRGTVACGLAYNRSGCAWRRRGCGRRRSPSWRRRGSPLGAWRWGWRWRSPSCSSPPAGCRRGWRWWALRAQWRSPRPGRPTIASGPRRREPRRNPKPRRSGCGASSWTPCRSRRWR